MKILIGIAFLSLSLIIAYLYGSGSKIELKCYPDNSNNTIISLSTVPDRIVEIGDTIQGLANESSESNPIHIFINIPHYSRKGVKYIIPNWLKHSSSSCFTINRSIDWGPATKFIPTIKYLKSLGKLDTRILVVDDDQIYHKGIIKDYHKWSKIHPNSALTYRGHIAIDHSWRKTVSSNINGNIIHTSHNVDIITGVGSYMIKPSMFPDEYLWTGLLDNTTNLQNYIDADDIWISGVLNKNNITRLVIPSSGRNKGRERSLYRHIFYTYGLGGGEDTSNNALLKKFF